MPVVDASIVVDWVAPDADPDGPAVQLLTLWADAETTLLAPRILMEEVSNALLTGCRRGRWNGPAADRAYQHLRRLPIALRDDAATLGRAWDLSRRHDNHPVYDMLYVALADQHGEQMFTADQALLERMVLVDFVVGLPR